MVSNASKTRNNRSYIVGIRNIVVPSAMTRCDWPDPDHSCMCSECNETYHKAEPCIVCGNILNDANAMHKVTLGHPNPAKSSSIWYCELCLINVKKPIVITVRFMNNETLTDRFKDIASSEINSMQEWYALVRRVVTIQHDCASSLPSPVIRYEYRIESLQITEQYAASLLEHRSAFIYRRKNKSIQVYPD